MILAPIPQLYWKWHPELISSFKKMGPNDVFIVEQDHMHKEGVLMELKILHSSNLCIHYLIMDHLSHMGSKVIPNVCMDILNIQCHDVQPTLCIGGAIYSRHQI